MEFSFSASGWLFIYQLGVARTFQLSKVHLHPTCARCTGSSGGALVGACLTLDTDITLIKQYFLDCVMDCKKNPKINTFKMRKYVEGAFDKVKKIAGSSSSDFYDHANIQSHRLGVSVTTLPSCENHIITQFDNQRELEEAILGSCTMSPVAGFPFRLNREKDKKLHNKWVFDGGLSNIQPHSMSSKTDRERIVTVSVFSHWDSDIRPSRYIPIWWTGHPPAVEDMEALYFLGMHDAEAYLNSHQDRFKEFSGEMKDELVFGEALSEMVAVEENNSYTKFDADDTARGRRAPSFVNIEEDGRFSDKTMDDIFVLAQKNMVRGVALGSIYAELAYMSAFNLGKGLIVKAEEKRRNVLAPSKHLFSIRRWLPEGFLGNSSKQLEESATSFKALFKLREIWKEIMEAGNVSVVPKDQLKIEVPQENETDRVHYKEVLIKNSYFYREFLSK